MHDLTGNTLPLIQAPMAGVQGSALARAVCAAGGLGSLPCAMLAPDALRRELDALRAGTAQAFNLNFFCHAPPEADARREQAWRDALAPYYRESGLDETGIPAGPGRVPFDARVANLIEPYRPAVVSFHFGLPAPDLLARVKSWGTRVFASATTIEEARWLEARGVDAVIAQGLEAGAAIEVMTPTGRFGPRLRRGDGRTHVAFAAGSGITPVLSILRAVLAREPQSRFFLFYGNRATADIMFRETLEELKDRYQAELLLRAPELVSLDCNRLGVGMGYWQDNGGHSPLAREKGGCFLACKFSMTNDEWYEVECNPTHFIVLAGD